MWNEIRLDTSESVYRRYAIVDATMLRDGGQKLQALHATDVATSNVGALRK